MMVKGVDVDFVNSSQTLVLLQDRSELPLPKITRAGPTERHYIPEFFIVEHRNFNSTSPAPKELHTTEREFSSLVS
jgi:hypothetical protein